jgi:hypothetical protein
MNFKKNQSLANLPTKLKRSRHSSGKVSIVWCGKFVEGGLSLHVIHTLVLLHTWHVILSCVIRVLTHWVPAFFTKYNVILKIYHYEYTKKIVPAANNWSQPANGIHFVWQTHQSKERESSYNTTDYIQNVKLRLVSNVLKDNLAGLP